MSKKKILWVKNTKIRSRNSGATCFQHRPFPTNFSRQIERYGPKLWFQKVVGHKSRNSRFFTLSTSWNAWLCVSIEKAVKAENRLLDQKSKVVPNDPQMVWEHFGDVFRCFRPFLGDFTPHLEWKTPILAISWRFWLISRDLLWNLACIKNREFRLLWPTTLSAHSLGPYL